MRLSEISSPHLLRVDDNEILSLHFKMHELWGTNFAGNALESAGGMTREDIVNAHLFLVREMKRRGMNHTKQPGVDGESLKNWEQLCDEVILIPDFVDVVGSSVREPDINSDTDILIRAEIKDDRIWMTQESILIPVRKALDPDKGLKLHFVMNPQGPHADYRPLYDLVLRPCVSQIKEIKAITPGSRYMVMKPKLGGFTDFFDTNELWTNWASKKITEERSLLGSTKIDGFRTVLSWNGKWTIWFEDSGQGRDLGLPPIKSKPFVIEGEFAARRGEVWLARSELAGVAADPTSADPFFWLFDLLYFNGQDLSQEPFAERLAVLRQLTLPVKYFTVLQHRPVEDKAGLAIVGKWAMSQPLSEGLFLRETDAPYTFGSTNDCAKLKVVCELKVQVIEVLTKQNGVTYHCGLSEPGDFTNQTEGLLDLGNTFVGPDQGVKAGDTLNVVIEELVIGKTEDKSVIFWGKPTVKGPDKSRNCYTVDQAIDLARRARVLKEESESKALVDDDRASIATSHWEKHWFEAYPKNGRGEFIAHHHYRGLDEEDINLPEAKLLQTPCSIHGDLRCSFGSSLWGFTVFYGTAEAVREAGGDRLASLPSDDALQGTFKLFQPLEWLRVGRGKPYVSEPGGAGTTTNKYALFFAHDYGTYECGVWREHMLEIFLHGKKIKGRYLIVFAPLGGSRIWTITKPTDQAPYASDHDKEKILEELRSKGQEHLIWNIPGDTPEFLKP